MSWRFVGMWISSAVAGLALTACPATTTGGAPGSSGEADCPVGSEGCPCTPGGGCDAGLQCLSEICVEDPGQAGTSATATATTMTITTSTSAGSSGGPVTTTSSTSSATTDGGVAESTGVSGTTTGSFPDDPVAYWPFDEGAGVIAADVSGSGYDGTLIGATWAAGQVGSALQFDGLDDIVDAGDVLNTLAYPVTFAAWVYLDGDGNRHLLKTDYSDTTYYGYWLQINDFGNLSVSFGDGMGDISSNRRTKVTTDLVPQNTWFHVAAVVEGAVNMTIYIDGVDVPGAYTGSGSLLAQSPAPLLIGTSAGPGINPFSLDEVRIYDRALTQDEVQALASQ